MAKRLSSAFVHFRRLKTESVSSGVDPVIMVIQLEIGDMRPPRFVVETLVLAIDRAKFVQRRIGIVITDVDCNRVFNHIRQVTQEVAARLWGI